MATLRKTSTIAAVAIAPPELSAPLDFRRIVARHNDLARAAAATMNFARDIELLPQLLVRHELFLKHTPIGGREPAVEVVEEFIGIHCCGGNSLPSAFTVQRRAINDATAEKRAPESRPRMRGPSIRRRPSRRRRLCDASTVPPRTLSPAGHVSRRERPGRTSPGDHGLWSRRMAGLMPDPNATSMHLHVRDRRAQ